MTGMRITTNAAALSALWDAAYTLDLASSYFATIAQRGRLSWPEFDEAQEAFNRAGEVFVRIRDSVVPAIQRGNDGSPAWRAIVAKLKPISYSSKEVAGESGLSAYRNAPGFDGGAFNRMDVQPVAENTVTQWTDAEIALIAPHLAAAYLAWTQDLYACLDFMVLRLAQLTDQRPRDGGSGGGTAANVEPATGIHHVRPVIDGPAAKLGIASVFGLVLWFIFKPRQRRRSA